MNEQKKTNHVKRELTENTEENKADFLAGMIVQEIFEYYSSERNIQVMHNAFERFICVGERMETDVMFDMVIFYLYCMNKEHLAGKLLYEVGTDKVYKEAFIVEICKWMKAFM